MDTPEDQPDTHAVARERREAKRSRGMQVSGRSTKTVIPDLIARRGREADEQLQALRTPRPPASKRDTGADREP
jgi:hypothetical protein